jgi:hypothetical protein
LRSVLVVLTSIFDYRKEVLRLMILLVLLNQLPRKK